jgi:FKBP-type peptidyl-prolyl cis-trans isomerase
MNYIKSFFIAVSALLICIGVSAQKQHQKVVIAAETNSRLVSSEDTLNYVLGAFVGQWLKGNEFIISNPELFNKGIDDVIQKKQLLVNDSIILKRITSYQLSSKIERSIKQEQQLFASLKAQPGVGVLPDGVHYIVVKSGTGMRPAITDTVVINAIGMFPDGTVFEDTYKNKQPIAIITGNLIPGLNETVQLMPEGSVWRIFVPSALAYGTQGKSNLIPPNTALIFDLALTDVKQSRK